MSDPDAAALARSFDAHYFAHGCGRPYGRDPEWLTFFAGIADRITADIAPGRVLDAGCAMGLLVEALRTRGVEADGVDISPYAIAHVHESVRPHCRVGSIAAELPGDYNLIVCIEVLEHMPPGDADAALDNFCRHTADILFSSSPRDYAESTHVNVRPPEAWAEAFARRGFIRDVDYDASFITPWAVRVRRRQEGLPRLVREYERALARAEIERNDLRAEVLRWNREVQTEASQAPGLRQALAGANEALLATQQALAEAHDRITHMERSRFWQARGIWVAVKKMVGKG
jgi:SAM-dependent methyltransferase